MGVFLYYFPGHGERKAALTRADVLKTFARESLWDVLRTADRYAQHTVANVVYHGGPDTGRGTILTCQDGNEQIPGFLPGYYPAKQSWNQVDKIRVGKEFDALNDRADRLDKDPEAREKYIAANAPWLGWYNDPALRPTPEHLLRLQPIDGEWVELGDGNRWQSPVIRTAPRRTITLPQSLLPQEDGSIVQEVKPEFDEFLTLSDDIWDHYWGVKNRTMDNTSVLGCVIKCLNLNYRVSLPEVNALRLLDSENWQRVFRASNNFELIEELMGEDCATNVKKKDSAAEPSEPYALPVESTKTVEV